MFLLTRAIFVETRKRFTHTQQTTLLYSFFHSMTFTVRKAPLLNWSVLPHIDPPGKISNILKNKSKNLKNLEHFREKSENRNY